MLNFLTNFLGFDHIIRASKSLCNHLEPIIQEQEIDPDVRTKNLNILKMMMYLFTQIMKTKDTKLAADVSINMCKYFIRTLNGCLCM